MSENSGTTERLAMLLACGSPGSAMAYHGLTPRFGADLVQRSAPESVTGPAPTAPAKAAPPSVVAVWFARLVRPFRESRWQREVRAREAYLAGAQNISDLEERMRALERSTLYGGRAFG